MKKTILALLLFIPSILSSNVLAATDEAYLLTEKTWNALSKINKLLDEGDANSAVSKLHELLPRVVENNYDHAVTQQTLGYAYNRLENYPEAISAFKSALNLGALPPDVSHQVRYSLAQIQIYSGDYAGGIKTLERWLTQERNPDLDALILVGSAYYETGQYDKAIRYAKRVIQAQPRYDDAWHQLLVSAYFKTSQFSSAATVLEKMIRLEPANKTYWQQLLSAWQNSGDDQKALATLDLMHRNQLLSADEVKQLINMYLYLDMPYEAAQLLEQKIEIGALSADQKNLEWMGEIWLYANERKKAATVFKQLANVQNSGQLQARIGRIYYDLRDYKNTITHLQSAVKLGGLEQRAQSYLLLGIAAFNSQNLQLAESAFLQANAASSTRSQAEWWLDRIRDEAAEEAVQQDTPSSQ